MNRQSFVKNVLPPILFNALKQWRQKVGIHEWEYIPQGWNYQSAKGWNAQTILDRYREKWPRFWQYMQSNGPLAASHESDLRHNDDLASHNSHLTFGYVLARAAHNKQKISILDWGGGIGHYYALAQALLPEVIVEYHCKDVPLLAQHGKTLFPEQFFYEDERCFERSYDFVFASTSLHYTPDWRELLRKLGQATKQYLYIAQLPVVTKTDSFVFVQRPYRYGYDTEYLAWCLNEREFVTMGEEQGMKLDRTFIYGYQPTIYHAPEQCHYKGYLWVKGA